MTFEPLWAVRSETDGYDRSLQCSCYTTKQFPFRTVLRKVLATVNRGRKHCSTRLKILSLLCLRFMKSEKLNPWERPAAIKPRAPRTTEICGARFALIGSSRIKSVQADPKRGSATEAGGSLRWGEETTTGEGDPNLFRPRAHRPPPSLSPIPTASPRACVRARLLLLLLPACVRD